MRGWILYVLASLLALSASLAWRLGDPSPWQSLGQKANGLVLRSRVCTDESGAQRAAVLVAFEVDGLRRETEIEGLRLGAPANCTATATGEIAEWPPGSACTVLLPDGALGPARPAHASPRAFAAAIAATALAAIAVLAGLLWSLRHDLRGAPTERPDTTTN